MEKKSGHSTYGSSYGRVLTNHLIIGQLSISGQERPGLRILLIRHIRIINLS